MSKPDTDSLSRWEILGAWLHVWTPRRGAPVPPIPWRKVAAGAVGVLLVLGAAVAFFGPRIADTKESDRRETARKNAEFRAREKERLRAEQVLHTARAERTPPAGLTPGGERRARRAMLAQVESSILTDARARVKAGTLSTPVVRVKCDPYPRSVKTLGAEETLETAIGRYTCLAVTRDIIFSGRDRGELGYPFWAKVNFGTGGYAWCKINPKPGELTGGRAVIVPLPKACKLN